MAEYISIEEFIDRAEKLPIIDVRSPSEYRKGHFSGAFNVPLFNDDERVQVGIRYKQNNRDAAIIKGLEIAGPKLAPLVTKGKEIAGKNSLLLHCWRGGLRSESMAWLFEKSGIKCYILQGGYKAFRRHVRDQFADEKNLIILGGFTGSGKTVILNEIEALGYQIIDLEGIAHHKGSAFGSLGQTQQPTTEQFENDLFKKWMNADPALPLWLEDESRAIGAVFIPDAIFLRMRKSHVITILMDQAVRIKRLETEYASFNPSHLKSSILKLRKRLGDQNTNVALHAIDRKDFNTAIQLSLNYYDKTYNYGLSRRCAQSVHQIHLTDDNPKANAKMVIRFASRCNLI